MKLDTVIYLKQDTPWGFFKIPRSEPLKVTRVIDENTFDATYMNEYLMNWTLVALTKNEIQQQNHDYKNHQ